MNINIYENKTKRCSNKDNKWDNKYGPAIVECDYKTYFINGKLHNLHGPAAIYLIGVDYYFLDNHELTKEQWETLRHDY